VDVGTQVDSSFGIVLVDPQMQ